MHLHYRNVNDAFRSVVDMLHRDELTHGSPGQLHGFPAGVVASPSRNGNVLMLEEPVTVTYSHPLERVLFNKVRDANPFFHLYESLWMLCGREDVKPLAYYAANMANYSDDGLTLNGAYGKRWRRHYDYQVNEQQGLRDYHTDQLTEVVNHLFALPHSRRAVVQMWTVEQDLMNIGGPCGACEGRSHVKTAEAARRYADCTMRPEDKCPFCNQSGIAPGSKDVCCNLSVMFALRPNRTLRLDQIHANPDGPGYVSSAPTHVLDMTVTNRSNDTVWGMLGANYVHFTFLQEYMAARLGVGVGKYHHFTNNLHAYTEAKGTAKWTPEAWLEEYDFVKGNHQHHGYTGEGGISLYRRVPLVQTISVFEREVQDIVRLNDGTGYYGAPQHHEYKIWNEPFLNTVARPMFNAFHMYKLKAHSNAMAWAGRVQAGDWRTAAINWLEKRAKTDG